MKWPSGVVRYIFAVGLRISARGQELSGIRLCIAQAVCHCEAVVKWTSEVIRNSKNSVGSNCALRSQCEGAVK